LGAVSWALEKRREAAVRSGDWDGERRAVCFGEGLMVLGK
jgi:hypothetical protein